MPSKQYIIKYSTSSSTIPVADWWGQSQLVSSPPAPSKAGSSEEFVVNGLNPGRTYYFAIRAVDDSGNLSEISNIAAGISSALSNHIVINEVQTYGFSDKDEFVELYNPTMEDVNLAGWKLSGQDGNIVDYFATSTIKAQSYFLIAKECCYKGVAADLYYSNYQISNDDTIMLYNSEGNLIDGFDISSQNPKRRESAERKIAGWDTDNDKLDFRVNSFPSPTNSHGETSPLRSVVISEIAWMGTGADTANDEWIELYNNTTSAINLAGWTLVSVTDNSPHITLKYSIPAQGFYLLERTSSTTVSNVSEDQIYSGSLKNSGEKLELRNQGGALIDMVDCSNGWFAGTTTSYSSMERLDPQNIGNSKMNWVNSNPSFLPPTAPVFRNAKGDQINGTPKYPNSCWMLAPQ